jgi:hypothetical protein
MRIEKVIPFKAKIEKTILDLPTPRLRQGKQDTWFDMLTILSKVEGHDLHD